MFPVIESFLAGFFTALVVVTLLTSFRRDD